MNRRQLFLTTAKAALATAFAGFGLRKGAWGQTPAAGQPGSPSATTTIPGTQLPPPDPPFGGGN